MTERLGKLVRFNARFFAYAGYHGFRAHACNPGRGNEKGRVEDGVKFVRNNFWPGRSFKDFHDLTEQARIWVTEIANRRVHRATRRIPELVFAAEEKAKLAPLRPDRYDTDEVFTKEVPPNFHLTYETNRYSVPWTMVGQVITVRVSEDFIRFFYNERQLTAHARSYGKHQDISKDAHKQGLLEIKAAAKDGRAWQVEALKYRRQRTVIFDELGYVSMDLEASNLFFQVISARHDEGLGTIVTTNIPFGEWNQIFAGNAIAHAIVDRLTDGASIFYLEGISYREARSKKDKKS